MQSTAGAQRDKRNRTPSYKKPAARREHKGSSLLEILPAFVAIDLETTGLDPVYDSIIEVGAVRVRNGVEEARFSSLINPGNKISSFITELTGITNEMLAKASSVDDVLPGFLDFIGADVVIGHNVNFDVNFLYEACGYVLGTDFRNDFIDTMRVSRLLFRSFPNHRLPTLAREFCICEEVEHRALADALVAQRCYQHMCGYMAQNDLNFAAMVKNPARRVR